MSESKHTPLCEYAPEFDGEVDQNYRAIELGPGYMPDDNPDGGFCLTGLISPANAAYIVKCCNAYPALVEALKRLMSAAVDSHCAYESLDALMAATRELDNAYTAAESALRAAGEEL